MPMGCTEMGLGMKGFEEYSHKYETVRMERRSGIIQVTFHTNGGTLIWGEVSHREVGYAFADVGSDPENKVVILTGTGDDFIGRGTGPKIAWQIPPPGSEKTWSTTALWDKTYSEGKRLQINLLDIEVPIICAVNGQARNHSEIALLCDIVLAEKNTVFQDTHFLGGLPPGERHPRRIPVADGTESRQVLPVNGPGAVSTAGHGDGPGQ